MKNKKYTLSDQPSLFSTEDSLNVVPQVLIKDSNKNVQRFNTQLRLIERLKKDKEEVLRRVEQIKILFDEMTKEPNEHLIQCKKDLLEKGIERMKSKSFTKAERREILDVLEITCTELENRFGVDTADLRRKMLNLMPKKEKNAMDQMMADKLGIEDFKMEDLYGASEESLKEKYGDDIFERLNELNNNFFQDEYSSEDFENPFHFDETEKSQRSKRKKSKKQIMREQEKADLENLKKKDFSLLYKALSKRVHPDLEQNADKKLEKENLMKRLVAAKNNKDLFELLLLEFELNKIDGHQSTSFDLDNIKRFNSILKQQIDALKNEIQALKNENPETSFYYQFFSPVKKKMKKNISEYNLSLEVEANDTLFFTERLKTVKETKELIKELRHVQSMSILDTIGIFDDSIFDEDPDSY